MALSEWNALAPVAATIALAVLAALPGRVPSPVIDPDDRLTALEDAATGDGVPWVDPSSGQNGLLVPAGIFRAEDGSWCRSYRITIDGVAPSAGGGRHVACRMAQGGWKPLPEPARTVAHENALGQLFSRGEQLAAGAQLASTPGDPTTAPGPDTASPPRRW
jgi:hypothetical protein